MSSVWLREATIAFRNVGGDRNGRTIQLVDQEPVAASELLRPLADQICEIDGLLVDNELLKGERHLVLIKKKRRVESSE